MAPSRGLPTICALVLCLAGAAQAKTWSDAELARVGEVAPDTGGATFWSFGATRVNDVGAVAFYARARLPAGSVADGIFVREGGVLRKRVFNGDPAPGTLGTFLSIESSSRVPAFNSHGDVAFAAFVSLPNRGLFLATHSEISLVALAGDPAPPEVGGVFSFFAHQGMDLNDAGELVFVASVQTAIGIVDVMFRAKDGYLTVVAAEGGPAPGGGSYSGFGSPTINERGDVAFSAASGVSRLVVAVSADGTGRRVANRGDVAPRTGGGAYLDFNDRVAIDDAGQVLFRASIVDGDVGHGVFLDSAGDTTALAVPGDPALGAPGGTVAYLMHQPSSSGSGPAVLPANIDTPTGSLAGLLVAANSGLHVARLAGEAAPAGGSYASFTTPQPAVETGSHVSFTADLADGSSGVFESLPAWQVPAMHGSLRVAAAALLLLAGIVSAKRRG